MRAARLSPRALVLALLAALVGSTLALAPADAATYSVDRIKRVTVPATTRQVIVVTTRSWSTSYATVETFERSSSSGAWVRKGAVAARIGARGMYVGTLRKQDSYTTPAGMYSITQAFGIYPNPGARLPYTKVDARHWWVEQRTSPYYNQMRLSTQGGFALDRRQSEHLVDYTTQYRYAAVINFNRPNPVVGRGAGIFLHVNGPGATAGCVSMSQAAMHWTMRWLDPAKHPMIVMGPTSWLSTR